MTTYCELAARELGLLATRESDSLPSPQTQKEDAAHLHQLVLHAALDSVDERVWDTTSMYLKARPRALLCVCA